MTAPTPKTCKACGAEFGCNPEGDCWCSRKDYRLPLPRPGESQFSDCLCPSCLDKAWLDKFAGLSREHGPV